VEHRHAREQILLAGLPDQERRETLASMRRASIKKLNHLRIVPDPNGSRFESLKPRDLRRARIVRMCFCQASSAFVLPVMAPNTQGRF
jgi:hypothetical protein